jgi:putative solute:sodium symporter small subunit
MNPTPPLDPHQDDAARRRAANAMHWERTRKMTLLLLALWLATGFGTVFFARELARVEVFGWPLSFYMAAQGASLVSLAIIGFYAWRMRRLDRDAAANAAPNTAASAGDAPR